MTFLLSDPSHSRVCRVPENHNQTSTGACGQLPKARVNWDVDLDQCGHPKGNNDRLLPAGQINDGTEQVLLTSAEALPHLAGLYFQLLFSLLFYSIYLRLYEQIVIFATKQERYQWSPPADARASSTDRDSPKEVPDRTELTDPRR